METKKTERPDTPSETVAQAVGDEDWLELYAGRFLFLHL